MILVWLGCVCMIMISISCLTMQTDCNVEIAYYKYTQFNFVTVATRAEMTLD